MTSCMIKLSEIIQGEKIHRDAFIYLTPKEPKQQFAQCGTCRMWTGNKCSILGDKPVTADMSCALYVHGTPSKSLSGKEIESVTPKEAGLVKRPVRCENCRSFDKKNSICLLFKTLNEAHPDLFDLDTKVEAQGCCNAQMPG